VPGLLTHSPSDIARELLIDLGLGTDPDSVDSWPVYIKTEPDQPDNTITVNDTPGIDHGRVMIDGERQENPGVQIRVRSKVASTGRTKIDTIAYNLDTAILKTTVAFDSATYEIQSISRSGQINDLGRDPDSGRNLFTLNATINLRETT